MRATMREAKIFGGDVVMQEGWERLAEVWETFEEVTVVTLGEMAVEKEGEECFSVAVKTNSVAWRWVNRVRIERRRARWTKTLATGIRPTARNYQSDS
jgi:hypothetical protein